MFSIRVDNECRSECLYSVSGKGVNTKDFTSILVDTKGNKYRASRAIAKRLDPESDSLILGIFGAPEGITLIGETLYSTERE